MIDVPTCQQCGSILVCVCCPPGIMREIEGLRAGAARMAKEVADLTRERDEAREAAGAEKLTLLAERYGARSACEAMTKDLAEVTARAATMQKAIEHVIEYQDFPDGHGDGWKPLMPWRHLRASITPGALKAYNEVLLSKVEPRLAEERAANAECNRFRLEAVTRAERAEALLAEAVEGSEEDVALRAKLTGILDAINAILKPPEGPLESHGWADLPEMVSGLKAKLDEAILRADRNNTERIDALICCGISDYTRGVAEDRFKRVDAALKSYVLDGRYVPEARALLAEKQLGEARERMTDLEAKSVVMRGHCESALCLLVEGLDVAAQGLCDRGSIIDGIKADLMAALFSESARVYAEQHDALKVRCDRLEADLCARNLEVAEVRVEAERIKEECARIADRNVDFVGPGTRSVIAEAIARQIRALPSHFGGGYICDVERKYRTLLWQTHGHPLSALYGDDGEMQCNADGCHLDFVRDSLEKLEEAVRVIVGEKLKVLMASTKTEGEQSP